MSDIRYFRTSNATRPYRAGGFEVYFEPIGRVNGTLHGLFRTYNKELADTLIKDNAQVSELSAEEYESVKKKPNSLSRTSETESPKKSQEDAEPVHLPEDVEEVVVEQPLKVPDPLAKEPDSKNKRKR